MTCDETRELLSELLDEALDAGERARVEAHLMGCADCRRELDGLRATTGLLARVERARAPVGFVDRVMTQVRPVPWYRRLGRALFFPLSIKLPLEAGAMVMVAFLGVYLLQTTPELKEAARRDSPAPTSSPPAIERSERSAPSPAPPPARGREAESKRQAPAPAFSGDDARHGARDEAQKNVESPAPPPGQEPPRTESPAARSQMSRSTEMRESPPASSDDAQHGAKERLAPPSGQEPAKTEAPATRSERSRSTEALERLPKRTDADKKGVPGAAPAAPFFLSAKQQIPAPVVSGALTVTDRQRAEQSLAELIRKTGAREIARREENGAVVVEVAVPQPEYAAFTRELAALGSLRLEDQPTEIPPLVRLNVRISE